MKKIKQSNPYMRATSVQGEEQDQRRILGNTAGGASVLFTFILLVAKQLVIQ